MTAILKNTGLQQKDVLYANFQNKIYEVPFFVAVDHRVKSVVVAIRGTMSLKVISSSINDQDVCEFVPVPV